MLQVDQVSKRFGERHALADVSFGVGSGRITGFVGANGAGKTTAMRIILGVLTPDSGSVTVDGRPIDVDDRHSIGYMPEERGLYPKMKVAEQVAYLGRLHGMSKKAADDSTARLLDRLDIAERANDAVETLSLGNQQRAQIAAALVHEPKALVLDEPFSGLDPIGVETVLSVLRDAAAGGAPVLFSSHQLDVVERLCDDLVIIAGGQVRAAGSRDDLRAEHGGDSWHLSAAGDLSWVASAPGVTGVEVDGSGVLFHADADAAQNVVRRAVQAGPVTSFGPQHPSLAQIFAEVVK